MLRDEVDRENTVEDEAIPEDQVALLVSLDDLAIRHFAVDRQQRVVGVFGENGESFLRTTLLHTLQTDVRAFQSREADEERICGLGNRGEETDTNSQVLSMPNT